MRMLVLAAAIVACGGDVRPRLDLSKGFTVRLTLGGGSTPFYDTVAIDDTGHVERTFEEAGSSRQTAGSIDRDEVAQAYGTPIADGPIVDVEVETPAALHVIRCEGTCNLATAPRALGALASILTEIRDRVTSDPPPQHARGVRCVFYGALETIEVADNHLTRLSAGPNHRRDIEFEPVATGSGGVDLIFVAYAADDYPPIASWNGPDKPREHLVPHASVVAHLATVDGEPRIEERDVDLHTGMHYQTRDHSYPCAFIDATYDAAHPGEFVK
jgi:hypothetical protein